MKQVLRALGCCAVLLGCESRFVEKTPSSVSIQGAGLSDRVAEKSKIDTRLAQVDAAAGKVKTILAMFRKVASPSSSEDTYTPIDFIFDLNAEIKNKIPENLDKKI